MFVLHSSCSVLWPNFFVFFNQVITSIYLFILLYFTLQYCIVAKFLSFCVFSDFYNLPGWLDTFFPEGGAIAQVCGFFLAAEHDLF